MNLQEQYDKIASFFKTTTEPFDELNWDGDSLLVFLNEDVIEKYSNEELLELIDNFS